eukprot:CAMPEP_0170550496 /NCGR_PEP_ID=MMETSP0211-20121228/8556_1 /TAXON_ID=311385 /ORGANISM="Pseudokeronopsis sp., Strain OXSARD2" /LENGTH=145 /DNA_ID=CAMNT_0010857081 /DNA_START=112 /DNA_END=549 /DNA_ORIENTATION=+
MEGQKVYLIKSIVRMQAVVRGFLARQAFYQGMKNASFRPTNPNLRKKLVGYKLSRIGKQYVEQMAVEREGIMKSIQNVDKSIKDTESLLESFIPNMSKLFLEKRQKMMEKRNEEEKKEQKLSAFWSKIKEKAQKRDDKDCPICYN